jgi:hypothetical protein
MPRSASAGASSRKATRFKAPSASPAASARAAAVISGATLGGQAVYTSAAFLVVNGAFNERAGSDVAGAGDVDGDGFEDLLVGAYLADDIATDAGRAGLFYGAAGLTATVDATDADASFFGGVAGEQLGNLLAGVGDWDGDGRGDLLVGSSLNSESAAAAGADVTNPISVEGQQLSLARLIVQEDAEFAGKTVGFVEDNYHLSMVLLRHDHQTDMHPRDNKVLHVGDVLAVLGGPEQLNSLMHDNG